MLSGNSSLSIIFRKQKKVNLNQSEKLQLLFQISIMLCQQISITQALEMIINTSKTKKSILVCKKILYKINQGRSIVESVGSVLKLPAFFSAIINSGERTGRLGEYLFEAYKYCKKNADIKNKQKMQSFYPIFVFVSTLSLSVGIIAFAVPTMVSMADTIGLTLPSATVSIINLTEWFRINWIYFLFMILVTAGLFIYIVKKYRYYLDWLMLKIPFVGLYARKKELVCLLTLFSMLLKDKIPVEKSLRLSIESIQRKPFQDELLFAVEEIYDGKMDFSQLHKRFGKDIYIFTFLKSSVNGKQLIENTNFITL